MARSQRSRRKPAAATKSSPSGKRPRDSMDLAWADDDDEDAADEHIDSDDEDEEAVRGDEPSLEEESDDEDHEPLEAKRVRLARQYLEKIDAKQPGDESSSDEDDDDNDDDDQDEEMSDQHDVLGQKLQRERQKKEGSLERNVADKVQRFVSNVNSTSTNAWHQSSTTTESGSAGQHITFLRGHDLTPTCVALSGIEKAVSGSKDHSVILWDIETQVKIANLCPQWSKNNTNSSKKKNTKSKKQKQNSKNNEHSRTAGQVLCVACSDDERYVAVGSRDATVRIFDIRAKAGGGGSNNLVKTFEGGHKGPVTCLAFRSQSNQLFSGSADRCIRHYNLDEMLYLETLYGHQFGVSGIDCYKKERPISVGEDRTARAWKLSEDSHLIFRGGGKAQAADCVSVVKDDWFLTGHQDGGLGLWMSDKKRAVATIDNAHGINAASGVGRNVVSVACLKMSDLAATGSNDGHLRFWRVQTGRTLAERGLTSLCDIPIRGYINSIAFAPPKAKFCVVAVGQEHRLGRWDRIAGAKNRIAIVKLQEQQNQKNGDEPSDGDDDDDAELMVCDAVPDEASGTSSSSSDDESESE